MKLIVTMLNYQGGLSLLNPSFSLCKIITIIIILKIYSENLIWHVVCLLLQIKKSAH